MCPKPLISLLVMVLFGANTVATAVCASYCDSLKSANSGAAHHHDMGSQSSNKGLHLHGHGMGCTDCQSKSGLSQSSDCNKLVEAQAIKENSASQARPSDNAPSFVATVLADMEEPRNPDLQLRFNPSERPRNSYSPPAPLRI